MDRPLVIPVKMQGKRCVVYEDDINAEGKLFDLQKYLMKHPWVDGNNIANMTGKLLDVVAESIGNGTDIYICDVLSMAGEYGHVLFINHICQPTPGMPISWDALYESVKDNLDLEEVHE